MTLNETFTHPAYILGRLFAVLDNVQIEAIFRTADESGDSSLLEEDLISDDPASRKTRTPRSTIKNRYFASACATPATVFPVLLKLAQHHITKAKYGRIADRRIQELLIMLPADQDAFPKRLSLDEQGIFIIGFYHQRAAFYAKGNEDTTDTDFNQVDE